MEDRTKEETEEATPNMVTCSICSTSFSDRGEPIQVEGPSFSTEADWKTSVFEVLCHHLQAKDVFDAAVTNNALEQAMKVFRLCSECVEYGSRFVVLNETLSTILTEIDVLAQSFRNVISSSPSPACYSLLDSELGGGGVDDGHGHYYIQQFIKKVMEQSVPVVEPVPESCMISSMEVGGEVEIENSNGDGDGQEVFQGEIDSSMSYALLESAHYGIGYHQESHSNDGWDASDLMMMSTLEVDVDGHEAVTEEAGPLISPSPPYSPLSVKSEIQEDSDDDEELSGSSGQTTINNDDLFVLKDSVEASCLQLLIPRSPPPPSPQSSRRGRPPGVKVKSKGQKKSKGRPGRPPKECKSLLPPKTKKEPTLKKVRKTAKSTITKKKSPRGSIGNKLSKIVKKLKLDSKILASLPPHDVEGYKVMSALGIPFKRLMVKLNSLGEKSSKAVYFDDYFDVKIMPTKRKRAHSQEPRAPPSLAPKLKQNKPCKSTVSCYPKRTSNRQRKPRRCCGSVGKNCHSHNIPTEKEHVENSISSAIDNHSKLFIVPCDRDTVKSSEGNQFIQVMLSNNKDFKKSTSTSSEETTTTTSSQVGKRKAEVESPQSHEEDEDDEDTLSLESKEKEFPNTPPLLNRMEEDTNLQDYSTPPSLVPYFTPVCVE